MMKLQSKIACVTEVKSQLTNQLCMIGHLNIDQSYDVMDWTDNLLSDVIDSHMLLEILVNIKWEMLRFI